MLCMSWIKLIYHEIINGTIGGYKERGGGPKKQYNNIKKKLQQIVPIGKFVVKSHYILNIYYSLFIYCKRQLTEKNNNKRIKDLRENIFLFYVSLDKSFIYYMYMLSVVSIRELQFGYFFFFYFYIFVIINMKSVISREISGNKPRHLFNKLMG